jgi:IS1 family transposase/transposase-like protein
MDRNDCLVFVTSVLMVVWFWQVWRLWQSHGWKIEAVKKLRQLRARTPHDCPYCRQQHASRCERVVRERELPRPWSELKSRRGRKKQVVTEGHACRNPECAYRGIRNQNLHALIGYGSHGKCERIQDFYCQACGKKVTSRWETPMYRLKTATRRVAEVLTALAEGLDLSAAVRVFGHGEGTMRCWLARASEHGERMHERHFRDLWLRHVQLDELVVQIRGKGRDLWLWVALEAETKLMPVLQLGPRTQEVAHGVVHLLRAMLASGCVPAFTSDGLNHYFYSLTAHFGEWQEDEEGKVRWVVSPQLVYAQLKKIRVWRRLVGTEQRVLCGSREMLRERLHVCGLRATIQTAFVERVNLTLRQSVAGLARRTWSTAVAPVELEAHLMWYQAYYHFSRPHESLRLTRTRTNAKGEEVVRYRNRTPAMAAGLTRRRFTVKELLLLPLPAAG